MPKSEARRARRVYRQIESGRTASAVEALDPRRLLTTVVPATGDLWLAGMPAGTSLAGDVVPTNSPRQVTEVAVTPGAKLSFSATGTVNYGGGTDDPPEGELNFIVEPNIFAQNGISTMKAPVGALIGAFIGPGQPDSTVAPAELDFSTIATRNQANLSPLLKQSFYIGDGKTNAGATQTFTVPSGATRLFLGSVDGSGWFNNTGQFNVTVTAGGTTTPKPQLTVSGNGTAIAAGDTTPGTGDFTNLGSAAVGAAVTKTFTLKNTGTAPLTFNTLNPVAISGTNAGDFRVVQRPTVPGLAPGASTTMKIEFAPSVSGTRAATVTVNTNDPAHAAYAFALAGTATGFGVGNVFGGGLSGQTTAVKADAAGNVYVTGFFKGTANFAGVGATPVNLTSAGDFDLFVAKYSPAGTLLWAKRAGSTGEDEANGLTLDAGGNVVVTGDFSRTVDFDPGSGTHALTAKLTDAVVWKLDSTGNYQSAWQIGGVNADSSAAGYGIAVAADGGLIVTGRFVGKVDFNPGTAVQTLQTLSSATGDLFVLKLSSAGALTWADQIRETKQSTLDVSYDISPGAMTLDAAGNVVVAGDFNGAVDFDPGTASVTKTVTSGRRGFVLKLSGAGKYAFVDTFDVAVDGVASDLTGGYVLTATSTAPFDADPGSATHTVGDSGKQEAAVIRVGSTGAFTWATAFGKPSGSGFTNAGPVVVGANGVITVAGNYGGTTDFDPGSATLTLPAPATGDYSGYVEQLSSAGGFLSARALVGTAARITAGALAAGPGNRVTVAGQAVVAFNKTGSIDLDPGAGTKKYSLAGGANGASYEFFDTLAAQATPTITVSGNGNFIPNNSGVSLVTGQDFGSVTRNTAKTVHFAIKNTGTSTLTIAKIIFSGANPDDFTAAIPSVTVDAGTTMQFDVIFKPTVLGTRNATITIATNDPLTPNFTFSLTGKGT